MSNKMDTQFYMHIFHLSKFTCSRPSKQSNGQTNACARYNVDAGSVPNLVLFRNKCAVTMASFRRLTISGKY